MRIRKAPDVPIIDNAPLPRSGPRSLPEREAFGCGVAGAGREGLDLARRSPPQSEVARRDVSEPRRQWVSGLTVTEVRELADWLEGNGCTGVEVSCQGEAGFTLGCICPPGAVLGTQGTRVLLFRA